MNDNQKLFDDVFGNMKLEPNSFSSKGGFILSNNDSKA
jgi:hypothetical protein